MAELGRVRIERESSFEDGTAAISTLTDAQIVPVEVFSKGSCCAVVAIVLLQPPTGNLYIS